MGYMKITQKNNQARVKVDLRAWYMDPKIYPKIDPKTMRWSVCKQKNIFYEKLDCGFCFLVKKYNLY